MQQGLHKILQGRLAKSAGTWWGLEGDRYESDKYDPTMSRRWDYVQHDAWRNNYGIIIKVRNIVYDKNPLQKTVSQETIIWATHEGIDNDVGAFKLFQQDHQWAYSCSC